MAWKNRQAARRILTLAILLSPAVSQAEMLPLWEAGAGVAPIWLPSYRGSDVQKSYALPFPYFVYRGQFLKADRNGLRGQLFESERVDLNISVNGSLPVSSDDNPARSGMASLKPTVELGPTLNVNLWESTNRELKLDFRAPVRTAVTIESSSKQIGWLFSPSLNLDIRNPGGYAGWNLGMLAGPIFSSKKYNAYFYSVTPQDVTPTRPAYSASGGYSGSQLTFALSKRYPRYWVGSFLRYDTLGGAVFEDSPLVRKRNTLSAGFAVAWVFGQSSVMVSDDE